MKFKPPSHRNKRARFLNASDTTAEHNAAVPPELRAQYEAMHRMTPEELMAGFDAMAGLMPCLTRPVEEVCKERCAEALRESETRQKK